MTGLLAAARIEYITHRDESRIEGSLTTVQETQAAAETRASSIAEWQPAMVPGLVQTTAYARELFERPDRPKSGPVVTELMRLTDDGCGITCESACPAQSGC